jgi:hypothetical protein
MTHPIVIPEFGDEREAAAWMIRMGRALVESNVPISNFISRTDNNRAFNLGFELQAIGRRIATSYEFGEMPITDAMYKAHIQATRQLKLARRGQAGPPRRK